MFKRLINFFMKSSKNLNYVKEQYRGTLKQIMKVRGLRTISLNNYHKWKGDENNASGVHSLKLDVQSGYINVYGYNTAKSNKLVCSAEAFQDVPASIYRDVYEDVMNIIKDESSIPYNVRKNILVRVAR